MSFRCPFKDGWVFPHDWLNRNTSRKRMCTLYHPLWQLCSRRPEAFRRVQVLINVDNKSVVGAFDRGRAADRETHALPIQLSDVQVE